MTYQKIFRVIGIALAFGLAACSTVEKRSDFDIEADVSVNVHPSAPNITVSSDQQVVTLSGVVKDSAAWKATMDAASSTKGVKKVIDKLLIATSPQK